LNDSTVTLSCVICGARETVYLFRDENAAIVACSECNLISRAPLTLFEPENTLNNARLTSAQLFESSYIEKFLNGCSDDAAVLLVKDRNRDLGNGLAKREGTFIKCDESECLAMESVSKYDCVILWSVLEQTIYPDILLQQIHRLLKPAGQLLIVGMSIFSEVALGQADRRVRWRKKFNFSFSRSTLQLLLEKSGFHRILLSSDGHTTSFRPFVSAWKAPISTVRKLSIVMPVYNEKNTFAQAFSMIIDKQVKGIDEKEIIIVESNSTDGSREAVETSAFNRTNVKVIFEDKPSGKGHAVREGLKYATGEIVLIQDADLEYDVDDYDALVKPLLAYKRTFVLGTRHSQDWKIRQFTNQPMLAFICNIGHLFFTSVINILYRQRLTDPFTMYKVFRRECLYGLHFECNRFDFDHELVIKLIRKGYRPAEISINYRSRSFAEGKKVTFFRDPLTWLIADLKYRFTNPFDHQVITSTIDQLRQKLSITQEQPKDAS
jgi:glycosyltransferase involved in cell wall biosynthesis